MSQRSELRGRWRWQPIRRLATCLRRRDEYPLPPDLAEYERLSLVLGRVSDRSVTVSALAHGTLEGYFRYGTAPDDYKHETPMLGLSAGKPVETVFDDLQANRQYFYRLYCRKPGESTFDARPECRFHTQRAAGSTFRFGIQGDSHPERAQMNDPERYARTLLSAASGHPDFDLCLGDDFSVDTLRTITADTVAERYTLQRPFLGLVSQSAPLFLVNGNHEQASLLARQELDGVVYQEVPNPADQGYVAYNEDRFAAAVTLPNSGHLWVTVSPEQVKVDYVRCYLPKDETATQKTGQVAYSYTVKGQR